MNRMQLLNHAENVETFMLETNHFNAHKDGAFFGKMFQLQKT